MVKHNTISLAGRTPFAHDDSSQHLRAMAEISLDISLEFPKRLTTDQVQAADIVITMFVGEPGPSTRGKRYLDRELPRLPPAST